MFEVYTIGKERKREGGFHIFTYHANVALTSLGRRVAVIIFQFSLITTFLYNPRAFSLSFMVCCDCDIDDVCILQDPVGHIT